jgi:phage terminase small subunit
VKTPNGYLAHSPYLAIATRATEQLVRILVEFGMTPSSRSRIHVPGPSGGGGGDPQFDRFFGGDGEA